MTYRVTKHRHEVDPSVLAVWERLREIITNEEAWHILEEFRYHTLTPSCEDCWDRITANVDPIEPECAECRGGDCKECGR